VPPIHRPFCFEAAILSRMRELLRLSRLRDPASPAHLELMGIVRRLAR
jgi:hypothetical protein